MHGGKYMGKKWNPDVKPAEKLLALYSMMLFTGRELSLSNLSQELNCSKQAVARLVDQLEASRFGKLLRAKRGREVVFQLDRPKHLPKVSLNAEGLYQLALCRDFILHLLPESMRKTVDATLQQANAFLSEGDSSGESFGKAFAKGRIDYTPFQAILQTLIRAIRGHKVCSVRYKSGLHAEAKAFDYAPKRLVAFHEAMFLSGWIVTERGVPLAKYEAPTTLAVHRLRQVTLTRRDAMALPEPAEENAGAFGLMECEPFIARIRFDKSAATYVAEREWGTDQRVTRHRNGDITLALTARSPDEIVSWVLGFGGKAEVCSPKWLREEIVENIRKMQLCYTHERSG
ncbi:MAG: WYL domain-containing protein [Pseudomonadota bacterium]|nr:WYL domain-containing protein [Pseudomonadota bacterium]